MFAEFLLSCFQYVNHNNYSNSFLLQYLTLVKLSNQIVGWKLLKKDLRFHLSKFQNKVYIPGYFYHIWMLNNLFHNLYNYIYTIEKNNLVWLQLSLNLFLHSQLLKTTFSSYIMLTSKLHYQEKWLLIYKFLNINYINNLLH